MSWQEYVDKSLVGSGHLDKAAIFSANGDNVWAQTKNYSISSDEVKEIVACLAGGPALDNLWTNGLYVGGERFVVTTVNESNKRRSIYARKGKEGTVIRATIQAILIAHYGENAIAGNAVTTVEKLADYLISVQY